MTGSNIATRLPTCINSGLVVMGRHKCEVIACLSSQMQCKLIVRIVYWIYGKINLIRFDLTLVPLFATIAYVPWIRLWSDASDQLLTNYGSQCWREGYCVQPLPLLPYDWRNQRPFSRLYGRRSRRTRRKVKTDWRLITWRARVNRATRWSPVGNVISVLHGLQTVAYLWPWCYALVNSSEMLLTEKYIIKFIRPI